MGFVSSVDLLERLKWCVFIARAAMVRVREEGSVQTMGLVKTEENTKARFGSDSWKMESWKVMVLRWLWSWRRVFVLMSILVCVKLH